MDMPWVTVGTVMGVCGDGRNRLDQSEDAQSSASCCARRSARARRSTASSSASARDCSWMRFQHTLEKPEPLLPAYALLNRIRMCASHEVLAAAERLLGRITDQYFSSNLSAQELYQLARSANDGSIDRVRRGLSRRAQLDPCSSGNQASAAALAAVLLHA